MTQVKEVNWEGKTKGGVQGHKFFIFILKTFGLGFAYFFLRIVAFYYFLFDPNRKIVFNYFREIHGYSTQSISILAFFMASNVAMYAYSASSES